jgi:hypothetical protein
LPELVVRDADNHDFADVGEAEDLAFDVERGDLVSAGFDDVEGGAAEDEIVA